jgi:DNA gyrase subunit B/topoisomerase-4 subunit B
MAKEKKISTYKAKDIEVLEGLEPVRKRPGMYIGGTEGDAGLLHLIKEILDNSIDEAMNGHADAIWVTLHKDQSSITIEDNGRGIPVDTHPRYKKPALEIILTTLHAGGKFSDSNYASAGGLHGVGASVVNALSQELEATVWRDGFEWSQRFSRGKAVSKLNKGKKSRNHGTRIYFRPDGEIFRQVVFNVEKIETILEEKAFLNRGLKISFRSELDGREKTFQYAEGLKAYLITQLERQRQKSVTEENFYLERANGILVQLAFCWTESTSEKIYSYVNGIVTPEGGSHVDGFKAGLSKAVRNYLNVHDLIPRGMKLAAEDLREGLLAILSVNVPGALSQLQFQGQTKDKLNNPEISAPVESLVKTFENYLNSKPNVAAVIAERVISACKARNAARLASQSVSRKVGISHRLNLPGKLADCATNNPDKAEIFIVEGDSAGGSAKQARDRKTQAILPLKGKIINTFSASKDKIELNKELTDLISALGCGHGDKINLQKLRYSRVVILTDADADGMHIASLLMAFFFKSMRPLIEAGHLYVAMSPLYRIKSGQGSREKIDWLYSDEEMKSYLDKSKNPDKHHITRFKGLGEMNPDTLWETTLNPQTRNLLRIQIDSEEEAQATFDGILGRDTEARYRLIQENAHRLDVDI